MMKKSLLFLTMLLITTLVYSQEKMEVEGAIIIKDSEAASPLSGTIRFNPTTNDFEGWNGIFWASLTGVQLGTVTDIDGNEYATIDIGTQKWMAENLRTSKYRNGDAIPIVTNNTVWDSLSSGAYCWYNNDTIYETPYGKLYNWFAVDDSRGLCPTGWHVPTYDEWTTLADYFGGIGSAGGKLKEAGTTHWNSPNTGATNESGFTGLPGGARDANGPFYNIEEVGRWWTSTGETSNRAWYRVLSFDNDNLFQFRFSRRLGFSVRCIRD